MKKGSLVARTFVWGGCLGVAAQLLMYAYGSLGLGMLFTPLAMLLTLGIVGCALFAVGLYGRIEETGSVVSFLPFNGLGPAVAAAYLGAREQGASVPAALGTSWRFFFVAAGPGIGIALVTGALAGLFT